MNPLLFQPQPHSAVPIGLPTSTLLSLEKLCQFSVRLCPVQAMNKVIVATSGHTKELTHDGYGILSSVAVYYPIRYLGLHFLSADCRKSRSSSFSIFSRLFSYLYSANVFAGFRPLCLGTPDCSLLRSLHSSRLTTYLFFEPSSSAISR